MLRTRPEHCPLCGHDVRGVVRCAGCGERLLVANEPALLPRVIGGTGSIVAGVTMGVAVAVGGVVHPLLALAGVAVAPVAWGAWSAIAKAQRARRERGWRVRERGAPPSDSIAAARQALAHDAGAVVCVRGRVQLEIPIVEGTDHAVSRGAVGRFVVYASDGEALIDDDCVDIAPELTVRDGALVEVEGPARLVLDDALGEYRAARPRIVFSGTARHPLTLRAL